MFLGHFAVGYAAKAAKPNLSLGLLFIAAQFIDLLWPTLLLVGLEHVQIEPGITVVTPLHFNHYPISHSLLMTGVWSVLFSGLFWIIKKDLRGSLIIGFLVLSHWFLDLIVHRPDLPLKPGETTFHGFNLWDSLWGTIIVEGLLFAIGVYIYFSNTSALNKRGGIGSIALVIFFLFIYASNLFGPPPPNATAIAWAGQLQWILVFWAYWSDKNRIFGKKS